METKLHTRDMVADASTVGLATEAGLSFVFRYGVVVTVGSGSEPTERLAAALKDHVIDPTLMPESESASLESDLTAVIGSALAGRSS